MRRAVMNHRILERIRKNHFAAIRHRWVIMQHGIHIGVDESFDLGDLLPKLIRQTQIFRTLHGRIILRKHLALQVQNKLL